VCVLTRNAAIQVLSAVTCAPITRTIRGIRSEVEVGPEEGLPEVSAINCDNIVTLPVRLLASSRVGHLSPGKRAELDHAVRYALDIQY
jgi:mRNA interferase MazF